MSAVEGVTVSYRYNPMLKNLFKPGNLKRIYLAGTEVILNGNRDCENFIATQITNKATVESIDYGLELVFEHDKLIEAYKYEYGEKQKLSLSGREKGLQYQEFKENKILQMMEDQNGPHQLGGEPPVKFEFPDNDCIVPFQYLGFLSDTDPHFNWLPFTLLLTCPIYLNIGKVFLDYSNPYKPVIINRAEVEKADTSFAEDLNRDSEIVFNAMRFSLSEARSFEEPGHSGIPCWIQNPEIPVCPKTGNRMKFLL